MQALAAKFERVGGNMDAAAKSLGEVAFGYTKDTFSASSDPYGKPWKKLTPAYAKWKRNNLPGDKPIGARHTTMWNKFSNNNGGLSSDSLSFTLSFDVPYAGYFSSKRPLLPGKTLPRRWVTGFDEALQSFILEMMR